MPAKLRNLGPASARMLDAVGIRDEPPLRARGAVATYAAIEAAGLKPSLNLLWALEGALTDRDWKQVSRDERTSLLMQLEDHRRRRA